MTLQTLAPKAPFLFPLFGKSYPLPLQPTLPRRRGTCCAEAPQAAAPRAYLGPQFPGPTDGRHRGRRAPCSRDVETLPLGSPLVSGPVLLPCRFLPISLTPNTGVLCVFPVHALPVTLPIACCQRPLVDTRLTQLPPQQPTWVSDTHLRLHVPMAPPQPQHPGKRQVLPSSCSAKPCISPGQLCPSDTSDVTFDELYILCTFQLRSLPSSPAPTMCPGHRWLPDQ